MKYFFNYSRKEDENLNLMAVIKRQFAYVFDDHDQEGQLDGERLLGVKRARDEVSADVCAHDLED